MRFTTHQSKTASETTYDRFHSYYDVKITRNCCWDLIKRAYAMFRKKNTRFREYFWKTGMHKRKVEQCLHDYTKNITAKNNLLLKTRISSGDFSKVFRVRAEKVFFFVFCCFNTMLGWVNYLSLNKSILLLVVHRFLYLLCSQ